MSSDETKPETELVNRAQNDLNSSTTTARIFNVTDALRSKHTKVNYGLAFKQFLKDGAKTQDLQVLLDYKPKVIEQMVIGYIENLRDKGRSHATIQLHCAAIFHFFEMNDVVLNRRKITRFIPPNESASDTDGVYTADGITKIINEGCNDLRSKLMVLLMASTGMRAGALPGLLVGHLEPRSVPNESKIKIYTIQVYAGTKSRYYTFTTPECTALIDSYLDYRRRLGEKITDKSHLIREMFDSHNPFIINAPKKLTERMIQIALEQALRRANVNQRTPDLDNKGKRREIMRSHGFRKWTITQMIKARIDYSVREFLVGHKVSRGLDFNYDRTSVEDRLQEWSKAIDFLTIDQTQRLKKRNEELETLEAKHLQDYESVVTKMYEFQDRMAELEYQVKKPLTKEEYRKKFFEGENPAIGYHNDDNDDSS